jgi:acyl-coenzyme A synthetase/AMP-(fatty) acid ligase
MLVPYPLAPPPVKQHLLTAANCKVLFHITQDIGQVEMFLQPLPHVKAIMVPDLNTWLSAPSIAPIPCRKAWQEGKDDPWLIFHTSGTTGLPKLVTYTQRMMTSFRVAQCLPEPKDKTQLGWHINRRCYAVAPMSHFSGLCAVLQTPVFLQGIVVIGPAIRLPTPAVIAETLRYSKVQGLVALPSQLRGMVRQPKGFEILKGLNYIQWVGAALDEETGNKLSESVKLCPAMGSTECGPYFLNTVDDAKDWSYYSFQSGQGVHFVERADNLYELVFCKDSNAVWQQIFLFFPNLDVYETKDLFRKHPFKDELWAYVGRSDDVVVLSSGFNINAAAIEEKLIGHPDVQMAFVGGSGYDHSFAILELTAVASNNLEQKGAEAVLETVWPAVEEANSGLTDYTRLTKSFIVVTGSKKGLVKSPKGTVMRGPSVKAFEKEIETLFTKSQ